MKIIKRNGEEQGFNPEKIRRVINLANSSVAGEKRINQDDLEKIFNYVMEALSPFSTVAVEMVQDKVRDAFMNYNYFEVAESFVKYRAEKANKKKFSEPEEKILAIVNNKSEDVKQDNANKNPIILSTQRDYIAGTMAKAIAHKTLPKEIIEAHDKGIIHFHDMDYSPLMHMTNCQLVNLKDIFENGFELSGVHINQPKSFRTACTLASQCCMQVASLQYGGQTMSWAHIAKYVDVSRKKLYKQYENWLSSNGEEPDKKLVSKLAEKALLNEIKDGVQTLQYQVQTLMTSNGQTPFITMTMNFFDCDGDEQWEKDSAIVFEEVLKQRISGLDDGHGNKISAIFPKIVYVLDENNNSEETKYWYLTQLAAQCTAKRMVPDYFSAYMLKKVKGQESVWCPMGCRSVLTPYTPVPSSETDTVYVGEGYKDKATFNDILGKNIKSVKKETGEVCEIDKLDEKKKQIIYKGKYFGRFNGGVVSLNVPYVALESKGNKAEFWSLLDKYCELCYRALVERYKTLKGTKAEVAPLLWMFGSLTRLNKNDTIDNFITGPYCTYSLGYVGLWEASLYMTGKKLSDDQSFAREILTFFNKKHDEWHKRLMDESNPNSWLNTSTYGTPEEQLTDKFAKALKRDFGKVDGVTDHDYVTNSYHVNPAQNIDAFSKLTIEGKLQDLSVGGAVSYVELPNMQHNMKAVEELIKFMYKHILYAELNSKSDICYKCRYTGEVDLVKDDGKYVWQCPVCKNRDATQMRVIRRVCGYLGDASTGMAQGRLADIHARVLHLN